jgi:hypothetical protein
MTKKIENAIETSKHIRFDFLHIGNPFNLTGADRKSCMQALKDLEGLARQYLKVEMPKKITIEEVKPKPCPYSETIKCCTIQDYARNQALHDFHLWQIKCLGEVERTIREFIPHRDSECIPALVQVIHNLFNKES